MKTSIYVCYHTKTDIIKDPIFKYIYCGAAINGENNYIPGTLRDDIGDNISKLNPYFCECTGIYWAWKNDKTSAYIGFMHYRRHLNFSHDQFQEEDQWGMLNYDYLSEKYIEKMHIDKTHIENILEEYEMIIPKPWNVNNANSKNMYDHYKNSNTMFIEDYNMALDILHKDNPELISFADQVNSGNMGYFTNCFIMKRNIFNDYCKFLFNILFKLHDKKDYANHSVQECRCIGFVAEWLFSIYITNLKFKGLKIKECQRTFINKPLTINKIEITPSIPIVLAFNEYFSKYASACIKSIIEHTNKNTKYTIYILHSDINKETMEKIKGLNDKENIIIKFIDCEHMFKNKKLFIHMHFSKETYYRLIIPILFKDYEKVIYIDSDTIVKKDLKELYDVDLGNAAIAGINDYMFRGMCKFKTPTPPEFGPISADVYCRDYLELADDKYIQAGVLVINIQKTIEHNIDKKMLSLLNKKFWFLDQDLLNVAYKNHKKYLDIKWNIAHGNDNLDSFYQHLPAELHKDYFNNRNNAYIIHYAGEHKPWLYPNTGFADEFWIYARKTPYYEELVFSLTNHDNNKNNLTMDQILYMVKTNIKEDIKNRLFPPHSLRKKIVRPFYHAYKKIIAKK